MREVAQKLHAKHGTRPADLFAWTPFELAAVFTRTSDGGEGDFDRGAELRRVNHSVRAPKGLPPVAPSWLMPEVPRVS